MVIHLLLGIPHRPHVGEVLVHEVHPVALDDAIGFFGTVPEDPDRGVRHLSDGHVHGHGGHCGEREGEKNRGLGGNLERISEVFALITSFISHDHDGRARPQSLGIVHLQRHEVLREDLQLLNGVPTDERVLYPDLLHGVAADRRPRFVRDAVPQELAVYRGVLRRAPLELDGARARVVGGGDSRLSTWN